MKTIKSFEPDLLFERPASPFEPGQNILHAHADIFERAYLAHLTKIFNKTAAIDARTVDGLLLASAILFGALLDSRLWAQWLEAVRFLENEDLERRQPIWVDIRPPDRNPPAGFNQQRRWVADPLTHILLRQTLKWRWQMPRRSDPPVEVIAAYFRTDHESMTDDERAEFLSAMHQAALTKWRMRLPAFLIEAVSDSGDSISLTGERWHALFTHRGPVVSTPFPETESKKREPQKDTVLSYIQKTLPKGRYSPSSHFKTAARTLYDHGRIQDLLPIERVILQWAADRLDSSRCDLQVRRGLAPSTIKKRARNLLRTGRQVFGGDELRLMSRDDYINRWNRYLATSGPKEITSSDLQCFSDWLQRRQPRLTVSWNDDTPTTPSRVAAGILSTKEYAALLCYFPESGERHTATRLMLMLGFRVGLRWNEVIELDIADLQISDEHLELSVRDNSRRKLKTRASRRLIPLHLLLTAREVTDLVRWWSDRRVRQHAGIVGLTSDARDQKRLFPSKISPKEKVVNRAIAEITGIENATYHILRHSCGSYLIATLALPEDIADADMNPAIDPSIISHERRQRIAPALTGHGRPGLNALRAVGALLGHSGEVSTTKSYFHLHDWLVGIYVGRPSVQRGLPTSLAAKLLQMQPDAVERANRRAAVREKEASAFAPMQSRPQGRPRKGTENTTGSIILSRLTHRSFPAFSLTPTTLTKEVGQNQIPRWESLAGIMIARSPDEHRIAISQSDFASPLGQAVVSALQSLLESSTRGRNGIKRPRFSTFFTEQRPHRLTADEGKRLERYYLGVSKLAPHRLRRLCDAFAKGYDQPRGILRVRLRDLDDFITALLNSKCARENLSITRGPRSATIKVAHHGCADRSFVWAMLFATAVERGRRDVLSTRAA